ncbi:unnamed protein product [Brachionus calyciflorus]|uniref:Myotubularin phosphatase domain-containing protein n=1 Tax=Brachionus calyciflorus TaxID=104777 RepID=A0A813VXC3_9BILA|nr:unnamed protein product [Brachionus calyciflorus]
MKISLNESNIILKLENVQLEDRSNSKIKTNGILYLTSSHVVFIETNSKREIWIYFSLINSIEKLPLTINGSPILIRTKHFLNCLFIIPKERDCQTLNLTLLQYSRPTKYHELLCFRENDHLKLLLNSTLKINKQIYQLESEYARMGLPNNKWTMSILNSNYEICSTYPNILFVPSSVSDVIIQSSAGFRSRGRLPVLSYLHPNGASITRCSQPLSGFNGRCPEDEQLLQHILLTNENSKFMYVVDTRPKINAMANKAQGKGYENEANYKNIQFYFIGIENIHVMRSSLEKLVKCSDNASSASFLSELEKSEWLKHIKAVIDTSVFIMEAINDQHVSVLVHCSDGWDRIINFFVYNSSDTTSIIHIEIQSIA